MKEKKTRSVQYALRWRLVGNRWRLVGNQWRLVGSRQTSEGGCHSKKKKVRVLMAPPGSEYPPSHHLKAEAKGFWCSNLLQGPPANGFLNRGRFLGDMKSIPSGSAIEGPWPPLSGITPAYASQYIGCNRGEAATRQDVF